MIRYRYGSVANTQSQAGQVQTESYLLVDKETGLPLHSETVSQASGAVQGYNGLKMVTEITDLKTDVATDQFAEPTGLQKIESDQVRAQIDMIFNSLATVLAQVIKQGQAMNQGPAPAATATATATPVR